MSSINVVSSFSDLEGNGLTSSCSICPESDDDAKLSHAGEGYGKHDESANLSGAILPWDTDRLSIRYSIGHGIVPSEFIITLIQELREVRNPGRFLPRWGRVISPWRWGRAVLSENVGKERVIIGLGRSLIKWPAWEH